MPVCSLVLHSEAQLLFTEAHCGLKCSGCWQTNRPRKAKSFSQSWTLDGWMDLGNIFKSVKWTLGHILPTRRARAAFILVLSAGMPA